MIPSNRLPASEEQVPSMVTLMVEGGASPPAQQQNQQAKNREKPILVKTVSGPYEHGCAVLSANGGVAGQLSSRALSGALSGTPRPLSRVHGDHEDPGNAYPVPRFPPAHTSAAFEAMAARKSLILTPAEIYAEIAHHGEEKAKFGWVKLMSLCIIAGCYIGFGFSLCMYVGGNLGADILKDRPGLFTLVYGAVGFPASFTMIMVCGSELFTSMCAYMMAAWWEGKVTMKDCIRLWVVSWLGNFIGCAIFTGLVLSTGLWEGRDWYLLLTATKKVHHGFGNTLVRGIFANWLVGVAVWQANAAQDLTGKFVAIWLPISAFAMFGWEHSIANQYILPLSIALDPGHLTAYEVVVKNLIPSTLGNWIGGAVCVATTYALAYGKPNIQVTQFFAQLGRAIASKCKWGRRTMPQ